MHETGHIIPETACRSKPKDKGVGSLYIDRPEGAWYFRAMLRRLRVASGG